MTIQLYRPISRGYNSTNGGHVRSGVSSDLPDADLRIRRNTLSRSMGGRCVVSCCEHKGREKRNPLVNTRGRGCEFCCEFRAISVVFVFPSYDSDAQNTA